MVKEIEAQLTDILAKYVGKNEVVYRDTRLLHDLRLAGDDMWEYFDEVSLLYGIREPLFDFNDYFPAEAILGIRYYFFFDRFSKQYSPLTIKDLAQIIHEHGYGQRRLL